MDIFVYIIHMGSRKIATNIPTDLLNEAIKITGLNQTQTLVEGLKTLIAKKKRLDLLALSGKLHIHVNTDQTRKRSRS